jgi:hypothetical protein
MNQHSLALGKLYPNPVKDWLNWESKVNGKIEIWSLNGQILLEQIIEANKSYKLNVSNLARGIYSVRISIGDKRILIEQIVVQ